MSLERRLVLSRWLLDRLGANSFAELQGALAAIQEGPRGDGHSHFLGALHRTGLKLAPALLETFDFRVMDLERELARSRRDFRAYKYFQYLALLFTEIYLHALSEDPAGLADTLNQWMAVQAEKEPDLVGMPEYTVEDLRRLAFFMATGSGKTLLMHAHLRQMQHYLRHGARPDALLSSNAGAPAFDNILLITPGEGLTQQHLDEFTESHIPAVHLGEALNDPYRYADHVKVIEIHKLVEQASGDGVSIPLEEIGDRNLVLVDEGHKGTGSEAQAWKNRQRAVSSGGFLLEYSATFAQSIGAATRTGREQLFQDYGKSILFDYSYRWFYGDGFGKDFRVLNVSRAAQDRADELLMAGLLVFYRQHHTWSQNPDACRAYNVAQPLWVFVGSSVSAAAVFTQGGEKKSDVATVLYFLSRLLAERDWAVGVIGKLQNGESLFTDEYGDLFDRYLDAWATRKATGLYDDLCRDLFGGPGALEAWALKRADGEIGLRVAGRERWFGLVNIGDVSALKKYLAEHGGIEILDEQMNAGLFQDLDKPSSPVKLLIGARKFTEGWSSWRVSCMGLLNMGRSEGPLVIQLFGRGVRLLGRDQSLKRSSHLEGEHPESLAHLERLEIFGWNGDYIVRFKNMLEDEGFAKTIEAPVIPMKPFPKGLYLPTTRHGYTTARESWRLAADGPPVVLDRRPKVAAAAGGNAALDVAAVQAAGAEIRLDQPEIAVLLDHRRLYLALVEHKQRRGFDNLFIDKAVIGDLLSLCTLRIDYNPMGRRRLHGDADAALRTYLDRYVARLERRAESVNVAPSPLTVNEAPGKYLLAPPYQVRIHDKALVKKITDIVTRRKAFATEAGPPLPRLHIDQHLYHPLVREAGIHEGLTISPPPLNKGEARLLDALRDWWAKHHGTHPGVKLYVLRNLPKIGIGLYRQSGFFPDFIVWVKHGRPARQRIILLEPHGLHHETPAALESDKVRALEAFRRTGQSATFKKKRIELDGYIVTDTPLEQIPGGTLGRNREELAKDYAVVLAPGESDWWVPQVLGL